MFRSSRIETSNISGLILLAVVEVKRRHEGLLRETRSPSGCPAVRSDAFGGYSPLIRIREAYHALGINRSQAGGMTCRSATCKSMDCMPIVPG